MKYSIVMPVLLKDDDHRQVVIDTLESVKQNTASYEMIIVDDGSPLPTGFLRDHADVYIRHKESKGIAPSWNDGIAVARGKNVVVINDDIRVSLGWTTLMDAVFTAKQNCGVVGPAVAGPDQQPLALSPYPEQATENYKFFPGYCFMLRRDRFLEKFDEAFVPAQFEDTDYWIRVIKKGLRLYRASFSIFHKEGDVLHRMNYDEMTSKNKEVFIKKHGFDPIPYFYGDANLYDTLDKEGQG